MDKRLWAILVTAVMAIILLVAGCTTKPATELSENKVMFFKSSSCGCCDVHASYLQKRGFEVQFLETTATDLSDLKKQQMIPVEMQSCHTATIGGYFVEGHMPYEAIEKLLLEKPDIKGIALPGMPSGAPGMPGKKTGLFVIYAINKDGSTSEFMRI